MKQCLIIIFLSASITCSLTHAAAQDTKSSMGASDKSVMIGITGGLTMLSGNLAKTDYKDNSSGFAGSGYNFGVTGTWFLNKNFGISVLVSYQNYSIKGIDNIARGFQVDYFVDTAKATSKGNSSQVNVLVGPYYRLPLSDKFSIDGRLLVGLVDATLGGWTVLLTDGGIAHPNATPTQDVAHAATFGGQVGIGLKYNITDNWGVMLNGDYYYSKPNFSITNEDRNANTGRKITSYNEAITGINANLTLCYMLKRK
jgi:opacity protein-like surface antigen